MLPVIRSSSPYRPPDLELRFFISRHDDAHRRPFSHQIIVPLRDVAAALRSFSQQNRRERARARG
jgi:predicted trehalose synthase